MLNTTKNTTRLCRGCQGNNLFLAIDLGELPISNELLLERQENVELFPLALYMCADCSLGQVQDVVRPERLFRDYRYMSSMSSTFLAHAKSFCDSMLDSGLIGTDDFVVEIASNDGYLLRNFQNLGIRVLGVEPAKNISLISESLGIPTLSEFFTADLAIKIRKENGAPKLIIANNVMAHVPDIRDFMKGLSILCDSETLISIENPSIVNILTEIQFDTIYHEHYSYLSCKSVEHLASSYGLTLFDVELIASHGGSNRYWISAKPREKAQRLRESIRDEDLIGLSDPDKWENARQLTHDSINQLREWLLHVQQAGQLVLGYGAAAKASTLLNAAQIPRDLIPSICDRSPEKIGRYMPMNNYEIIDFDRFIQMKPDHILVFPWNIEKEITEQIAPRLPDAQVWVAIPNLRRVK
jgi:C-methyltransferase C-terminal domain/Putative zinc binding domain/Methyltransferase domain